MSDVEATKKSLLSAPWRKVGELVVEGEAGTVTLVIRRPPPKAHMDLLDEVRKAGLLNEKNEPVNEQAGLEMAARLFAPMLFLKDAIRPLFTAEEFIEAPWFSEACEACTAGLHGTKAMVEVAKGNSEATPT
jgi:hypothetical protein